MRPEEPQLVSLRGVCALNLESRLDVIVIHGIGDAQVTERGGVKDAAGEVATGNARVSRRTVVRVVSICRVKAQSVGGRLAGGIGQDAVENTRVQAVPIMALGIRVGARKIG